ncbi:MAG: protein YgfX [Pseudomonadota bacterium]
MVLLAAVHIGGALLIGVVPLYGLFKTGLWALLAASAVHAIRLHGLRTASRALVELELDTEGLCSVRQNRDAHWRAAEIVQTLVHPWLVMLVLKPEGRARRLSLVIAADAVEAEAFRRLRARLRLQIRAA